MSDLVGNPNGWFSHAQAQIIIIIINNNNNNNNNKTFKTEFMRLKAIIVAVIV